MKGAWKEHNDRLQNVEFPWNPDVLSEESPVQGLIEETPLELITEHTSKKASGKAVRHSGIAAEMLKSVGEVGAVEVHDLLVDIIPEGYISTDKQKRVSVSLNKGKGMF